MMEAVGLAGASHHFLQLVLGLCHPLSVVAIHHEYESLRVLEVVFPQRPNLVLAADVPHRERDVLVLHCLHVKP